MGEQKVNPEVNNSPQQLRREAEALLERAEAYAARADELERQRQQGRHSRPLTREEVKRSLRVIQGGAAVVGAAAVWAWESARRPALAVAAGAGTVATSMFVVAPAVDPGIAAEPPPAVATAPTQRPAATTPEPTPTPVEAEPSPERASSAAKPQSTPAAKPTATATATSSLSPTTKPSPTPTAKATADVEVDLSELDAEAQLCLDVGLPPLADVGACLERAEKLGLDVGLGLLGQ